MKHTQLIALLMAAGAGLAACSSNDSTETVGAPLRLIVDVTENPLTDASASAKERMATRAAITTTGSLSAFSMNYLNDKKDFTKTDGPWLTGTWPTKDGNNNDIGKSDKLDFYAYSGGTFYYNSGNPYVAFTMAEDAFNQHDLLVAMHKQISYNDAGGHVSLTFDHACAAVQFNVQISNTLKGQLGQDYLTVNSIVLRNVNNTGRYYYDETDPWKDVAGSAFYTLTNGDLTVGTSLVELPCGYLFIIPQSRVANDLEGTYLEVEYTISSTKKTATIPLDVDWKAGEKDIIDIKLGTTLIKK